MMKGYCENRGTTVPRNLGRSEGFTLIEVLVAAAIASIILTMAYASYRSVVLSIRRSTGHAEFYENVNLAIAKMDLDISNTYFNRANKKVCFISSTDRGNGRLDLVTINHNDFRIEGSLRGQTRMSDVREVGYFLKEDPGTQGLFTLMRREDTHYDDEPEQGGVEDILLPNVVSLTFEFHRGNDWSENWDSRQINTIPRAVRTTLVVKNYQNKEETFQFISLINSKEFR